MTASGTDFYKINKKGNVPALVLENGTVLNENAAVLQWIADRKPGTIAPAPLTTERYSLINTLNYIASEVHPNIASLFDTTKHFHVREHITANAYRRLAYLDNELKATPFLTGATPTIADYYLYIVLSWTSQVGIAMDDYKHLRAFSTRMSELEAVKFATARMATSPATIFPVAPPPTKAAAPPRATSSATDYVDQPTLHCMP